ncbi:MAG: LutB/LldF family L-lactate oxidation iron-sulfur protein [Pseudomonadota bacterium]|nr:LutB/LldF family L-lactate oxidation iron-sulfur protein [Pseudomonadota bacterium]
MTTPAGNSLRFSDNAARAQADANLQVALEKLQRDTRTSRRVVMDRLPEFEDLRDRAVAIKNHTLAHLDHYLEEFEGNVTNAGGTVHWCANADDARRAILQLCRNADAKTVGKGKSMVSEEIDLNDYLIDAGLDVVETDLGEYILQLRQETPSHVVMPAIHLKKEQIADTFRDHHATLDPGRPLDEPRQMTEEARVKLREKFLAADVGITGANMLIAETGSIVVVTNEGNGDLTQTLPRVHIVLATIEKVLPRVEDALSIIRLLARSATGQEITCYTTFATGARRDGDLDGPQEFHLVLMDNGRTRLLESEFRDVLRCIRCGACQSTCPVYGAVGGHAYGGVYGGPIGAVLTPALDGIENAWTLPEASSLCGACEAVCPMRIPLPDLMRKWRDIAHRDRLNKSRPRLGLALWAWTATRPRLYRTGVRLAMTVLKLLAGKRGGLRSMPLAAGWTTARDLPAPEGGTFVEQWQRMRNQ